MLYLSIAPLSDNLGIFPILPIFLSFYRIKISFFSFFGRMDHAPISSLRGGTRVNLWGGGEGTSGVQGAEPFGGGQGAKPPEAEAFLVLKSW